MDHLVSMFEFLVDPCDAVFNVEGVDETDCRSSISMGSPCFLMTPYTRQFKKVLTLALALNCSCSALEFK